jgi:LysM repeat protein
VNSLQKIVTFFALAGFLFSGILAAEDLVHVVGRGETIYSISRFYRVSADELMRVNGITDPSRLQVGRRLTIPPSAFSDISVDNAQALVDYRVVRGDTLYGIARAHEISLQSLLDINKFPANHVIRAGDVIKVPGRAPSQNNPPAVAGNASLRWPVNAKDVTYMTGQMGVIVEGEYNESVKSLTQGRVISAGPWRKFGRVAIVEAAGGYFYMYGGCETLSVNVGDRITPGMELGKLGINTVSERPQLFFMVFRSDTPIDPAKAPRA